MNKLKGIVLSIESSREMSILEVKVYADIFSVLIVEGKEMIRYAVGDAVTIAFKETEVGLAKELTGAISFRNRIDAVIIKIEHGAIVSQITLRYGDTTLRSIVTSRAVDAMKLLSGQHVQCLIKANEISLMKDAT